MTCSPCNSQRRTRSERLPRADYSAAASPPPVIAVITPTTSRGQRWARAEDSPLARLLLASLARTADAGFEYRVYAAYDAGDLFYDDARRRAALRRWFRKAVAAPLRARGIEAQLALVRFVNVLRRPVPAANFAAAAALADGAEYVYSVDDDTELETPWAARFVAALSSHLPPNMGVVAPACDTGEDSKSVFVHRTHGSVFKLLYPARLSDNGGQTWMRRVYSSANFQCLDAVVVRNHTGDLHRKASLCFDQDVSYLVAAEIELGARRLRSFRNSWCNSISGCKTTHLDTFAPEAVGHATFVLDEITAQPKSVSIDSYFINTTSNYSRTEIENLDEFFDQSDESSTSDIIFAEGAEEVDELFRDIAILEGRLIDLIQEYGKQSAANIDALKKELWNPMLLPQEKLFRGPQWSPEYPAKLVNSLDLSAEAQLDSRWSNMSQLGWAMFDASAAPVT